jgi:hypothetical protein
MAAPLSNRAMLEPSVAHFPNVRGAMARQRLFTRGTAQPGSLVEQSVLQIAVG